MASATQDQLKIFLAGDVMTGRGIDQVLPYPAGPELHESYVRDARYYVTLAERENGEIPQPVGFDYPWGEALDIWQREAPGLRIVNLETSVTVSESYWTPKGIHYRMHPRNVPVLAAAGIDCCTLANNHVLDWGYEGLRETLDTLRDAGIAVAGAGTDLDRAARPARLQTDSGRDLLVFSLAAESSGVPRDWQAGISRPGVRLLPGIDETAADAVAEMIAGERRLGDLVIVSIHWGGNWGHDIPEAHRRFAHRLIDAGAADVIHGHSSHHPLALETYGGRLIIYGTGDFLTDYESIGGHESYRPWISCMYFPSIDPASGRLLRLEVVPLSMHRFRLVRASAGDRDWLSGTIRAQSRRLGTAVEYDGRRLYVDGIGPGGEATPREGIRHEQ